MSTRVRALMALVILVAAACGGGGNAPISLPVASGQPQLWPLRGTSAPDGDAVRKRPIVVKVAADPSARPQSGLADADLIIEIPVEGGLTRLSVVFQSKDPQKVGPVRSARQSDLQYLPVIHAIVAHVGASEQVTKLVRDAAKSGDFVDVDEFQHGDAFERTTDKPAPYNAYTTGAKIRQVGGSDKVNVPSLKFGDAASGGADAPSVTVAINEAIKYDYDSGKNAYHRSYAGGQKTTDATAGEVMPENVVVIKTDVNEIPGTADATGAPSVDFRSTGTGAAIVLRDGKRYEGTWSRQGSEMFSFKDTSGAPILLRPGLTWLHIVSTTTDVR
jgi:hypothetical protein